ncbi:unnamed protein product, partial [Phaeothamnion confervicola]
FSLQGRSGGGGGAAVGTIVDAGGSDAKFFFKSTGISGFDMLNAEYVGVKEMAKTTTVRVPEPVCVGTSASNAFLVFEYLNMGRGGGAGGAAEFGRQLARMHRCTSANEKYGFHLDNTCGATPQPNSWMDSWADFYDERRLGHMLRLCARGGATYPREAELRQKVLSAGKVHEILSKHETVPSLCHGDLWSGNAAYADGVPCIFDPSTYYGDREVDIAMTQMFGRQPPAFYEAYNEEWPLPPGHEQRVQIYNLYHKLNH